MPQWLFQELERPGDVLGMPAVVDHIRRGNICAQLLVQLHVIPRHSQWNFIVHAMPIELCGKLCCDCCGPL